jgi:pilus assembly protein CpaB
MKTRRIPLIIGLVLALGTGALLLGYLTSLRPSNVAGKTATVLVATHDIAAGTTVTSELFTSEQRIASQSDSDAIGDPKLLEGTFTLVAIPAGSIATRSKIGLPSAETLPARLPIGMRAVSIAIDNVKGVAGLVTPGDRVDVIAIPAAAAGEVPRGLAIVRDALVLAMGNIVATTAPVAPGLLAGPAPILTTVTLALTPNQVDLLLGADLSSTLRLSLRNPKEPNRSMPAEPLRLAAQGSAPSNPVSSNPAPAQQAPIARAIPGGRGVTVIDGDQITTGPAARR